VQNRWSGGTGGNGDHLWGGQDQQNPPDDPYSAPEGPRRHPGESNYGPVPGPQTPPQEPLRGFRLPDNEQPDHPWTTDDAPTRHMRATDDDNTTGRHHRAEGGSGDSGSDSGSDQRGKTDRD
jgi:cell division protease FtsH